MTAIVPAAAAAATMVDIVRARADRQPDRPAYTYLPEQEGAPAELLDYASLVQRAHAIAAALDRRLAGAPGAPRMAMLLFAPGPDFLAAFWGCLSARVIAIPAQLPRPGRCAATLEAIVRNAGVRLVLASRPQADAIGRTLARSRRSRGSTRCSSTTRSPTAPGAPRRRGPRRTTSRSCNTRRARRAGRRASSSVTETLSPTNG